MFVSYHFGHGRAEGKDQGRDIRTAAGTRMYCQGGDSDWAALRAMVSVAARLGSRPKITDAAKAFNDRR